MLARHELVRSHVAESRVPVVVLRADDGHGVPVVSVQHAACEAALGPAGDTATHDGIDEEQHGVPGAATRGAQVGGAIGDQGVADPGGAPARLGAVDGRDERDDRRRGGRGIRRGLGRVRGGVKGVVVTKQARPVAVAGADVDDLAAVGEQAEDLEGLVRGAGTAEVVH